MSIRVAAMCGSLRKGSFNQALLDAAIERAPQHGLEIEQVDISAFPLFTQELEGDPPAAVVVARRVVESSACVLLATPEYNQGVPGTLKNAVDWLSRPPGASSLAHRPLALMGASSGYMGTVRAQMAWRQVWIIFKAPVFTEVELTVAFAGKAVDESGRFVDETYLASLDRYLEELARWLESLPR